jgi:cyclopentanol dehydrogenase
MSGRLSGKTVIVTGATKGIGWEAALRASQEGAAVVATGRDETAGAALAATIAAAGGQGAFVRHDVRSEADWAAVIARAEAFGPLDGLVNNAGVFFVKPLAETTEADFDQAYQINLEGAFLGVKGAFEAFARGKRPGSIVNVSSLMGQVGFPNATAYCASKGGITGFTKAAAIEGAAMDPKVRVNSVHPGVIWTPMITSEFGDDQALADAFAADTPLRMIGLPEYVADAILFLVSDESAYVTGAELTVDGGRGAD